MTESQDEYRCWGYWYLPEPEFYVCSKCSCETAWGAAPTYMDLDPDNFLKYIPVCGHKRCLQLGARPKNTTLFAPLCRTCFTQSFEIVREVGVGSVDGLGVGTIVAHLKADPFTKTKSARNGHWRE